MSVLCLFIRSRLSVENPGRLQLALEAAVSFLNGMLDDFVGPKGRNYVTLVGTMFLFILIGNLMGLVPGLKSPTSNINVTLGCALTVFVYYQFHGIREQGVVGYIKHFMVPPGAPVWIAPDLLPDRADQPRVARAVALGAAVRQHFRRGPGHPDPRQHRPVRGAAADDGLGPRHRRRCRRTSSPCSTTIYLAGAVVVDHGPEDHGADGAGHAAGQALRRDRGSDQAGRGPCGWAGTRKADALLNLGGEV